MGAVDVGFAEYSDDFSLPVRVRLDRWEAWVAENWEPFVKARSDYELATGVVVLDDSFSHLPDAPFDPDSI